MLRESKSSRQGPKHAALLGTWTPPKRLLGARDYPGDSGNVWGPPGPDLMMLKEPCSARD